MTLWVRVRQALCAHRHEIRWRDASGPVYVCESCLHERRPLHAEKRYAPRPGMSHYDEAQAVRSAIRARTRTASGLPLQNDLVIDADVPSQAELLMDDTGPVGLVH